MPSVNRHGQVSYGELIEGQETWDSTDSSTSIEQPSSDDGEKTSRPRSRARMTATRSSQRPEVDSTALSTGGSGTDRAL